MFINCKLETENQEWVIPEGKPVFNVFDKVDPMSLKLLKDLILVS
ncbi:MAG: hypothetical protein ACOC5F_04460 [Candidatus Aminicenantaceae bacterium]